MIKEVATFVKAGKSDPQIYQAFEKKYGPAVLAAPKLEGFNVLAWVLPFVGLGLGAVIVVVAVRRLHPRRQESEVEQAPVEIDEKYRQLLDEELSE
jgi:cytochrome c-type biogenesis protein CcmH